ncbi:hypothetical protein DFH07DRAFT_773926 [Mycena maculata]|uniref:Uncharacterized protein n=1 Tax=Mycena maculata TaxID=230809 RepID=A0AAD7IZK3_9AGAR|nr:hypothetical protein DFH07DRAFT_773926 [Mycena maculata]
MQINGLKSHFQYELAQTGTNLSSVQREESLLSTKLYVALTLIHKLFNWIRSRLKKTKVMLDQSLISILIEIGQTNGDRVEISDDKATKVWEFQAKVTQFFKCQWIFGPLAVLPILHLGDLILELSFKFEFGVWHNFLCQSWSLLWVGCMGILQLVLWWLRYYLTMRVVPAHPKIMTSLLLGNHYLEAAEDEYVGYHSDLAVDVCSVHRAPLIHSSSSGSKAYVKMQHELKISTEPAGVGEWDGGVVSYMILMGRYYLNVLGTVIRSSAYIYITHKYPEITRTYSEKFLGCLKQGKIWITDARVPPMVTLVSSGVQNSILVQFGWIILPVDGMGCNTRRPDHAGKKFGPNREVQRLLSGGNHDFKLRYGADAAEYNVPRRSPNPFFHHESVGSDPAKPRACRMSTMIREKYAEKQ